MDSSSRPQKVTLAPAPATMERASRAQLIVIGGEEAGLVYPLVGETFTMGRGTTATVKIPDENVSRVTAATSSSTS
ncbi:MAG: FHA domain-containing protein, partial [Polyangiaceae bacterium]